MVKHKLISSANDTHNGWQTLSQQKSAIAIKLETDPEFRKRWSEKCSKAAKLNKNRHRFTKEEQGRGGTTGFQTINLNKRAYLDKEREVLQSLQTEDNRIFSNFIIDGFEFHGDTLSIVEVKINTGALSKNQLEFKKLLDNVKKVEFKIVRDKMDYKKMPNPRVTHFEKKTRRDG